jgi:hypothetical protein
MSGAVDAFSGLRLKALANARPEKGVMEKKALEFLLIHPPNREIK